MSELGNAIRKTLASGWEGLWAFLDSPEIGWHLILLVLLWLVGRVLVRNHPRAQKWGQAFAVFTLFTCLLLRWAQADDRSAQTMTSALGRSLLAAGLALGFGWTVFPALAMVHSVSLGPALRMLRRGVANHSAWRARRQRELATEAERREAERRWQAEAPERAARAKEEQRRQTAQADAERRRLDATARCEAFFLRHAPDFQKRFTREQFDAFVGRYLHEGAAAEEIAVREKELLALMAHHLELGDSKTKKRSLSELILWFNEEKRKLEALELPPDEEEEIVGGLEARFSRLQAEYIRSMQP